MPETPTNPAAPAPPTVVAVAADWLGSARLDGPALAAAEQLALHADEASAPLSLAVLDPARGVTHVADLDPGNGYRYLMVITLLPDPGPVPGDLIVTLPEHGVGIALDARGFHVPAYLDEKTRLGPVHCAVLAAFLTLLSERL